MAFQSSKGRERAPQGPSEEEKRRPEPPRLSTWWDTCPRARNMHPQGRTQSCSNTHGVRSCFLTDPPFHLGLNTLPAKPGRTNQRDGCGPKKAGRGPTAGRPAHDTGSTGGPLRRQPARFPTSLLSRKGNQNLTKLVIAEAKLRFQPNPTGWGWVARWAWEDDRPIPGSGRKHWGGHDCHTVYCDTRKTQTQW